MNAVIVFVYGQIYVRTCRARNGYHTGHADVLCNCYDGMGLRWGHALKGARCVAVADDSFPVLATLTPCLVKHKLGPRVVHGKGSWCLFCFAVRLNSTRRARPQLARYSINTKVVMGSLSPRCISHTSHSNINLA
jgi:hypothetical protein